MNELPGLEKGETSFAIYSCRSSLPPALSSVVPVWGGQHPTKPGTPTLAPPGRGKVQGPG